MRLRDRQTYKQNSYRYRPRLHSMQRGKHERLSFRFESSLYNDWIAGVSEACSFNLAQQLLVRSEQTKLISVNFDPQVWSHVDV